jgi:hypothetical protein
MTTARQGAPGGTRVCPHCRQTILESAAVCPVCRHHLRVGERPTAGRAVEGPRFSPLRVEGTIEPAGGLETWEYSVLLTVRNAQGEELSRQVMGVGGLQPHERRTFVLEVEVVGPPGAVLPGAHED